jgi:hypothetical protein
MMENNRAGEPLSRREAAQAMLNGEVLVDEECGMYLFNEDEKRGDIGFVYGQGLEFVIHTYRLDGLYRVPVPEKRKRLMTRFEALGWAGGEASRGWVVRCGMDSDWYNPQYHTYEEGHLKYYQRALLFPDYSGVDEDTIQGFEVKE